MFISNYIKKPIWKIEQRPPMYVPFIAKINLFSSINRKNISQYWLIQPENSMVQKNLSILNPINSKCNICGVLEMI